MSGYHKSALPRGERLDSYELERVLGHGGFGVTYLARDTNLSTHVAIKEYLPHDLAGRKEGQTQIIPNLGLRSAVQDFHWGLKRFLQEAQALAKFKHNNIVRVLRFFEANGTAYMVMEYEEGESLGRHLRFHGNRLSEDEIVKIYLPILNGLSAVHEVGLLHLDIKPDNIYLRKDGTSMLIDFGSARHALTGHSKGQRVVLTPGYAPIEQYPDKGEQGPWTDIYAIGASIYRCIKGKRPIDSLKRYQTILKSQVDPITPAVKLGANRYASRILECVDWAMQPYPTDRPKTARELQDAILGTRQISNKPKLVIKAAGSQVRAKNSYRRSSRGQEYLSNVLRFGIKAISGLIAVCAISFILYYFWPAITRQWPVANEILQKTGIKYSSLPPAIQKLLRKLPRRN